MSENNFTGHCFKNIATPPPFPKMIIPPCTPMHVHYATMKGLIHEGPEMQAYLYFLLQNDSGASTPDTVKPREVNKYVQCVAFTKSRWTSFALKLPPNVSSSFLEPPPHTVLFQYTVKFFYPLCVTRLYQCTSRKLPELLFYSVKPAVSIPMF